MTADDRSQSGRLRHARIEELFHGALELPAGERASFLDDACAEDPSLRAEVEALLDAHETGGVLADEPHGGHREAEPTRVGAYRLVRKIGEGGMGLVYRAEREGADFRQTVALKLVRAGFMDPRMEARFREERRILARLEHPGIARLIDGGVTEAGQPFYAMELVEGVDVLTYCSQGGLGVEQRLRVFLDICDPVRYAHQQLVVHRDLKPSNVLVGPGGRVKLLDFGVAKLLDSGDRESGRTAPWVTPNYAAPEQIRGAGTATLADVYALGVILYELLTERLPYDFSSRSPVEIERTLSETTPERPSAVAPEARRGRLMGDLDAITLTALAHDPDRRYPTVGDLAEDVRRYLERRPVRAQPDSVAYRMSRFVARHRAGVAAAALTFVTLVAGVATTTWQARQAAIERDRAAIEAANAERVSGLMLDIFRFSDPTQTRGDTVTARQILDQGTERIEREFAEQPDLQAGLLGQVADIYENLGMLERAESLVRRALRLTEQEYGAASLEASVRLAQLGALLVVTGRHDEGIEALDRAVGIRHDAGLEADTALATAQARLGAVLRSQGHYERAQEAWAESVDIRRAALSPDDPRLAESLMGLASAYHDGGRLDDAIVLFERILEEHGTGDRPSPLAATAALQVGLVYRLREEYGRAAPIVARAVAIREALFEPEHPDVIEALLEYGRVLETLGRYGESEATILDVRDRATRLYGREHPVISSADETLAIIEVATGRYARAAERYDTILSAKARRYGGDHADPMYTLFRAAEAPLAAGDFTAARRTLDRGVGMRSRLAGGQPSIGGVTDILVASLEARIHDGRGRWDQAQAAYGRSLTAAEQSLREGHRYRLRAAREQASFWVDRGRPGEAIPLLEEVVAFERDRLGPGHEILGRALQVLGRAHASLGRWSQADAALQGAEAAFSELPRDHWRLGEVQALLAAIAAVRSVAESPETQLGTVGGLVAADPGTRAGLTVVRRHLGPSHPRTLRLEALLSSIGSRRPVADDR